jgi:butyryl-CoA dehydrogenase
VQSRDLNGSPAGGHHQPPGRAPHADEYAFADRGRACAGLRRRSLYDAAHHSADAGARENQAVYEYLVPVIKGWSTELSQDVTRDGVQVHGGMGFIEETGAAQHYRDAKILTIYEGTTAIQANDLIGRKTVRDAARWPRA